MTDIGPGESHVDRVMVDSNRKFLWNPTEENNTIWKITK